jgi:PleD family two-component response regulator
VTVSIGLAASTSSDIRLTPAEVLRVADRALYRAKAKGRNCTVTARAGKTAAAVRPGISIVSAS